MSTVSVQTKKQNFALDDSIGYKVELTERMLKRTLTKRFNENGIDITPNQWVILYRLWQKDGLTQAEISEHSFKDKANVTRIIDLLVRKKLVKRVVDSSDRRFFRIHLLEKGKLLMEKAPAVVNDHIETATKGIAKKDIKTAMTVLEHILTNME